jgi:hypothetical protein
VHQGEKFTGREIDDIKRRKKSAKDSHVQGRHKQTAV